VRAPSPLRGKEPPLSSQDDRAAVTIDLLEADGGRGLPVKADVSNAESVRDLVDETTATYSRLDATWNNAGVLTATEPLHEMTEDEWAGASVPHYPPVLPQSRGQADPDCAGRTPASGALSAPSTDFCRP
jgi:hypothetical protein